MKRLGSQVQTKGSSIFFFINGKDLKRNEIMLKTNDALLRILKWILIKKDDDRHARLTVEKKIINWSSIFFLIFYLYSA